MPIRTGVIGTGNRMTRLCATIDGNEEVGAAFEFVALCDTDPERIAGFQETVASASDAEAFSDHREMLQGTETDLIFVGTPNYLHREQAVAAMEAGKDVFCEKPLATTIDDLEAIYRTHQRTGQLFMTGFELHYTPLFRRFREIIDSGVLGDVISVESNETLEFCHGAYLLMHPWRRYTKFSGGHLLEKCSHDIDLLNFVAGGLPARVSSFGGRNFFVPENAHRIEEIGLSEDGRQPYRDAAYGVTAFESDADVVDNQVCLIEYDNGVRACHHTNRNAGIPERRMHVFGAEGGLRMDFTTNEIEWARIGFNENRHKETISAGGGHGGGDIGIVKQLIRSVRTGEPPEVGCREGFLSIATALVLERARRKGEVVEMEPVWERFDLM